jgi:hypothetical protein
MQICHFHDGNAKEEDCKIEITFPGGENNWGDMLYRLQTEKDVTTLLRRAAIAGVTKATLQLPCQNPITLECFSGCWWDAFMTEMLRKYL